MWGCEDVRMWGCEDVKMSRCEDVKMRRCEDEKMWRKEELKMRRCEDEKMWRRKDVKWRCEDVKMWKCLTDPHYWKNPSLRRSRENKNRRKQSFLFSPSPPCLRARASLPPGRRWPAPRRSHDHRGKSWAGTFGQEIWPVRLSYTVKALETIYPYDYLYGMIIPYLGWLTYGKPFFCVFFLYGVIVP